MTWNQRLFNTLSLCIIASVITACSGSGNSPGTPAAPPGTSLRAQATTTGTVALTIGVRPSTKVVTSSLGKLYISPSSKSLVVLTDGTNPFVVNLTPDSPACSPNPNLPGGFICKASFSVPSGDHVFTLTLYDQTGGTGNILSTNTTGIVTVAPNANTNIGVTLQGVVTFAALSLTLASPPAGTAANIGLNVSLYDADHNLIIGSAPFRNPVTLSSDDPANGQLSRVVLSSPSDAAGVTVNYSGTSGVIKFSASATDLPTANVTPALLTPALGPQQPQLSTLITAANVVTATTSSAARSTYHPESLTAAQLAAMSASKLAAAHTDAAAHPPVIMAAPHLLALTPGSAYQPGIPPTTVTQTTVLATRAGQNYNGESSVFSLSGSAPFSEVIIAVNGFDGYYDLLIPIAVSVENISVTFAQLPPVTSFTLLFALGSGSPSSIGVYYGYPAMLNARAPFGDIQVNLSWNAPLDLDLHVVDPFGNEVYYGARNGTPTSTGGSLDFDSNPGCYIDNRDSENVSWPTGHAPSGTYTVRVDEYAGCNTTSPIPFTVTINARGIPQRVVTGIFPVGAADFGGRGSGATVATFTLP